MYADMTVSPKRSMTVRNIAIFETKNILVSKLRIWLGTTDGEECSDTAQRPPPVSAHPLNHAANHGKPETKTLPFQV